ncbi:NADPH-dependent FMN reductase [Enterococcus columbae]|uniref:Oxidoreductase n=1 Tax=Enterococcus columbae DSM 7374 = ATCC 51263 TaxID=1121865 RepID=S0K513_9ENTE|nr:NADPH-dependent FMN reductase [Enterococcus columbae]EOT39622.1 oxidoreductase [Enterococcus columbae DSM 7374 = ATCC 51263]EOW84015.1 oxidoreductase [Enterococcus columbae DSM 7374 = ATCC 51263]OJG25765.1 oxidoreductase [Enterococcus columbae DSM 7374 = ATCC 51263]
MHFIAIVGSNAEQSTNRQLLAYMQREFKSQADIELFEIAGIPGFNEPEDRQAPESIMLLAQKIQEADGVIISTPEYDHSIPAALKSVLEWLSYSVQPLINKPVMITGASHGILGSSRAQAHLRQILDSPELKARIMPSSEFLLGQSLQAFDEKGDIKDEQTKAKLAQCFAEFLHFTQMTNQLLIEHPIQTTPHFSWLAEEGKE